MSYDYEKEKREAIEAGQRTLSSLYAAAENLNQARNWGIVDLIGGRGLSTFVKHNKMNLAKSNLERAKYDLQSFSRELNDINVSGNLNIETGDLLSFADYFFDGLIVDWLMQDRINSAGQQVNEAIRRVKDILVQLNN